MRYSLRIGQKESSEVHRERTQGFEFAIAVTSFIMYKRFIDSYMRSNYRGVRPRIGYGEFPKIPARDLRDGAKPTISTKSIHLYNHSRSCPCCQLSINSNNQVAQCLEWTILPKHLTSLRRSMATNSESSEEKVGTLNEVEENQQETETTTTQPSTGALPGFPGSQTGGKKLAIIFTCAVCNTRAAKQFTEHAYLHGVVLVKCPGCNNQHLIADNLSMFTDDSDGSEEGGWNIEKAMAKIGQNVTTVTDGNVLELTLDQVVGAEKWKEAMENSKTNDDKDAEKLI